MIWFSILLLLVGLVAFWMSGGLNNQEEKAVSKLVGVVACLIAVVLFLFASVKIIKPGYVGVKRRSARLVTSRS